MSVLINMERSLFLPLIEQNVNPRVWADGKSVGQAQNAIPVVVKLKDPHLFPPKKQYPLKPEVKEGLKPIIKNLKEQGLLVPCNSPCNTPILGIKEQASFNFMAAVTICSDFGAQKNKVSHYFHCLPSICHEVMGPDAMILVF